MSGRSATRMQGPAPPSTVGCQAAELARRSDAPPAEAHRPGGPIDPGIAVPAGAAAPSEPAMDALSELHCRNRELLAAGSRLRLEQRGRSLGLRGPLPRADGQPGEAVQRLSLGLAATPEGLEQALDQLRRVEQELREERFDWSRWRRRQQRQPAPASGTQAVFGTPAGTTARAGGVLQAGRGTAAQTEPLQGLLQDFERAFFADPRRRRQPAGSRSTWRAAYRPYLRRLQQLAGATAAEPQPLSLELLEQTLESYDLASRSRQQCGIALAALARQQGLELPADWRERSAGYGLHRARFRQLPSEARILELVLQIPNPGWRLAYGLMATYGLRNHEVFFCDCSGLARGGDRVLRVLPTSKTGEHQVWPFLPEWVDHFGLERLGDDPGALPAICTDLRRISLKQVGQRVAEQFRRYGLPITPYDLRHAWAVRTIHIGLPDTVAARMMGHSVTIHTRTYHHWITRRDQQQAVDAALARLRSA